jgi:hypothetical protein
MHKNALRTGVLALSTGHKTAQSSLPWNVDLPAFLGHSRARLITQPGPIYLEVTSQIARLTPSSPGRADQCDRPVTLTPYENSKYFKKYLAKYFGYIYAPRYGWSAPALTRPSGCA